MTLFTDPMFYALAIPAVILTGISKAGFGGAIGSLSVPLMTLAIAPTQAVAIMLPILMAMDALGLYAFRGKVDRGILRIAIPAGLVGILIGWLLFRYLDVRWIKGLIGVEAIVFAMLKLLEGSAAWTGPGKAVHAGTARFWSAVAGFTSFVSHAGGPPMMQFMLPLKLHREIFVGTLAWFFAVINFSKIVPYTELGLFDATNFSASLVLMPAVPVGYWLGLRALRASSPAVFVRIATAGLLLTGVKLCWDALGA